MSPRAKHNEVSADLIPLTIRVPLSCVRSSERSLGNKISILKSVLPITLKGRDCLLECFVDVAAVERAETALHKAESRLLTLYEATDDAIMLLYKKGFFDCNDATVRIFGCAVSSATGNPEEPDWWRIYTCCGSIR